MTVTLITGANKGIGHETARQLAELGHTVYVGARSAERGRAAAERLGVRFVQIDVTDDASVAAAAASVQEAEGHLDVLVNNAGIAPQAAFGPDSFDVFNTNAIGVVRVTQAFLPLLRRSSNPLVVNIASSLGSFGVVTDPDAPQSRFSSGVYGASKAAVAMLTVQYAKAEPGIRFNAVEPGYTDTDFNAAMPGGRPVAESARGVVAMATTDADGPTGVLVEDGEPLPW